MWTCDFSKVANQRYWNHFSAWVFSCKFASNLQNSCFVKHLWGTTPTNFHSTCLPYCSIQIRVKFGLFSNIFQTNSVSFSEQAVLRLPEFSLFLFRLVPCEQCVVMFCWIVFLQGVAWLNCCWNAAWTAM